MEVLPPVGAPEPSVAERLRANFEKAKQQHTQELQHPMIEGLFIVFRSIDDFAEANTAFDGINDYLSDDQKQIELALKLLVSSSVSSYAIVDGQRHEIGLPLGVALYDYLFPAENGSVRPTTDGEALVATFVKDDGRPDTFSLVMFSRKLDVMRKMLAIIVEAEPGKS